MAFTIQHLELPGPVYYAGPISGWVTGANLAVQYATEADAQAVIDLYRMYAATLPSGSSGLFSGRLIGQQVFATAGTFVYTPTVGTNSVVVEVQGAGAGGGAAVGTAFNKFSCGDGGSGGAYARARKTAKFSGAAVVVGAGGAAGVAGGASPAIGGDSSFTASDSSYNVIGTGGSAGDNGPSLAGVTAANVTVGPNASGGDINIPGESSSIGNTMLTPGIMTSSRGGNSHYGFGGYALPVANNAAILGIAGSRYGGGGAGATVNNANLSANGGAGGSGLVTIWEYA